MNAQDVLAKAKQYPVAVGGGLVCVVIIVFLYFTSGTLEELESEYDEIEREAETLKQNEINSIGLSEDSQLADEMVVEIDNRLVTDNDKTGHKIYFQGLVEQSGVKISKDPILGKVLQPSTKGVKVSTEEFAQVEYSLEVSGEFLQVMDFLYLLRTGKHFIALSGMELGSNPEVAEDLVTADIQLRMLAGYTKEEAKKDD